MSTRKRREPGLRQLTSGRWQVRITRPDGSTQTVGTYDTQDEAKKARDAARGQVATGTWRPPSQGAELLRDYLERWLTRRAADWAPRTRQNYRDDARWILEPVPFGRGEIVLGDVPLNQITRTLVADWNGAVRAHAYDRVVARAQSAAGKATLSNVAAARRWAIAAGIATCHPGPRSGPSRVRGPRQVCTHADRAECGAAVVATSGRPAPAVMDAWRAAGSPRPQVPVEVPERAGKRTAAHAYALAHQVMLAALDEDLIARDPCRVKGAGAAKAAERKPATPAEVAAAAAAMPARWSAIVPVTAWGYMRKGEVLGLQRQDVTFRRAQDGTITGAQLRLERAAKFLRGQGMVIGPLKNESSRRTVPLPASTARLLAEHMEKFTGRAAAAHVFTGETGRVVDTGDLGRAWRRARRAAGRPRLHFHDLRHTGATEARRAGASLPELQRLLGHSTLAAVAIYQHVDVDDLDLVAARLDERLTAA